MCGIYGIFSPGKNVAKLTYFGMYALQHRGQESAGISVISDDGTIKTHKEMGLVSRVFTEELLKPLQGYAAIGQTRYSTTGSTKLANAQPILSTFHDKPFSLVHNGNLVNINELRDALEKEGYMFSGSSDSEIIAALISRSSAITIEDAIMEAIDKIQGAYSLLILLDGKLLGLRDPFGVRPLVIGELDGRYVLSSEDCALPVIGANLVREVNPGEMVTITNDGYTTVQYKEQDRCGLCVFEFIYFARPDSNIHRKNLHLCRTKMGRNLYQEYPVEADMVIGVPYSGTPAAIGFSKESGIPYDDVLIKNRYIGRTFIIPDQELREIGVKVKLNPIADAIKGKRIVLVDDSIVRGTTSQKIVQLLRDAGAKEVHIRISSPPVLNPCFYGIDTASKKELIAANYSVEEIQKYLKVDTIGYLSIEGMINAIHLPANHMCMACFNGDYPIKIPQDIKREKLKYE
ncbi:MAG: amidophosphoribosyltransferase [Candidatus Margulisiibacteriota bacterium]|nr:MAG: amidophosphoribosyltransferase [Candidatus Margulisbacteria bacterium GWD2_39_127]PZM80065.1 MAG: amidophosphoribosyltransferase [Candidatus Margulisiibacteriota bacterium]HAR62864.1 amidophosphoribosyltransferase [Candidatus Margulisiibacteriota bacterium]HCY35818.1 amidophosphoribosyltransferase [Candidatus Margulisiibacteriota bacterium]